MGISKLQQRLYGCTDVAREEIHRTTQTGCHVIDIEQATQVWQNTEVNWIQKILETFLYHFHNRLQSVITCD